MKRVNGGQSFHGRKSLAVKGRRERVKRIRGMGGQVRVFAGKPKKVHLLKVNSREGDVGDRKGISVPRQVGRGDPESRQRGGAERKED